MDDQPDDDPRFLEFWSYYPRHQAKQDARKAWRQAQITDETWLAILTALDWQLTCEQWTSNRGLYVPLPATYLRGRRWEDEPSRPVRARRDIPNQQTWRCPHQPAHCSRWACERQQALDEVAS